MLSLGELSKKLGKSLVALQQRSAFIGIANPSFTDQTWVDQIVRMVIVGPCGTQW